MDEGKLTSTQGDQAQQFIDAYLAAMKSDLDRLATRINEIATLPGVEVFALSDEMLERAISLRSEVPNLKPFDEAILAGILVRAARIPRTGAPIFFVTSMETSCLRIGRASHARNFIASTALPV